MQRFLPLLLLFLVGCQSLGERQQATQLEDTLRKYEATIRWGALEQARQFRSTTDGDSPLPIGKDLRVTHYEVIRGPAKISAAKVIQVVLIQYVNTSSQVVKELMDQQVWTYDEDSGGWLLQSPLPEFK